MTSKIDNEQPKTGTYFGDSGFGFTSNMGPNDEQLEEVDILLQRTGLFYKFDMGKNKDYIKLKTLVESLIKQKTEPLLARIKELEDGDD